MRIMRKHLRRMIVREAKRVLSSDVLFENILLNLIDSEDIDKDIRRAKDTADGGILDDVIELDEFKKRLKNLDDDKVITLLSKIRGSVSASTFNRIKEIVLKHKPDLEQDLGAM